MLLIGYQCQLSILHLSKFEFVHAEGVRIRCLGLRVFENFQKSVLSVHWIPILSMFRELLYIKKKERFFFEEFELGLLTVGDRFAMHKNLAFASPLSFQGSIHNYR